MLQIARNRALARLLLAYFVNILAEYGQWIAILVYAYQRGGATQAGLAVIIQLIPSILLAPIVSSQAGRLGVVRVAVGCYLLEALMLGIGAAAILTGSTVVLVYASAVCLSVLIAVTRTMHSVLMPLVVRLPEELTAANVATSWSDGLGAVIGAALAGILMSVDGPGLALAALAVIAATMAPLAAVRPRQAANRDLGDRDDGAGGALADLLAAARVIASRPSTRALIAYPAGAAAIEGAVDLLVVILAVKILMIGPGAAGYLSAAFGVGGLIGALGAVALVGRRLALPLAAAALIGSAGLAALALASTVIVAVVLLAIVGATRTVQSIAAQTLIQRSTPLDVLVCVFALIESMRDIGLAFGSVAVPLLVHLGGPDAAFIGIAMFGPIVVLLTTRQLLRTDATATIPVVEMGLLRNLEIFARLPAAPLETLAREASYTTVEPGAEIIHEGDEGDRYYAIVHGTVAVTINAIEVARLSDGDGFGEIALLHDSPRTATVTATTDTALFGVNREAFLTAMHASPSVHAAAREIAMARTGGGPD